MGSCPYKLRELGYIFLVRSLLDYSGAIWDTTVDCESDKLEMVQHRAARWARGAKGIVSVTLLLNKLNWQPLSDRRRDQRLSLFYKILHGDLNIPPESVELRRIETRTRKAIKHNFVLKSVRGHDQYSPFWKGPVARTLPVWNNLDKAVAEAGSFDLFKSRLAPAAP